MGRDWFSKIRLDWNSIKLLSTEQPQSLSVERLTKKYAEISKPEPGHIQGMQAHLSLRDGAQLRFHQSHSVPFAIKEKFSKELDRLEREGTIRKVDYIFRVGCAHCPCPEEGRILQNMWGLQSYHQPLPEYKPVPPAKACRSDDMPDWRSKI